MKGAPASPRRTAIRSTCWIWRGTSCLRKSGRTKPNASSRNCKIRASKKGIKTLQTISVKANKQIPHYQFPCRVRTAHSYPRAALAAWICSSTWIPQAWWCRSKGKKRRQQVGVKLPKRAREAVLKLDVASKCGLLVAATPIPSKRLTRPPLRRPDLTNHRNPGPWLRSPRKRIESSEPLPR